MLALGDLIVQRGAPLPVGNADPCEQIRWKDRATPLTISHVAADGTVSHRLRLGTDLVVDVLPDGKIIARHEAELPKASVDHFLADQVFPRLLAHDGAFVVHAGAVRVGSSAMMLMGVSGRGKSTLTASFDRSGFALLGDDAMVVSSLRDRPRIRAVYPSLRLFPDSIDALMPGEPTAGPVAHFTSKERIDVTIDSTIGNEPLPVAAIFTLADAAADRVIAIRPLTAAETCMALVESSFALDPSDTAQARRRLDDASALARAVPAFEIAYPRDYARLPEVRQAILDQVAALVPA